MTATFLVGDVRERMAELPDASVDLVLTSPPFLALRSYLPADHPDKAKEIGSEPTPAEFLQTLLELTAEWGRLLTPHGSIAVELGDTYAGSGGAGGDYNEGGLRQGQNGFTGSARRDRVEQPRQWSGGSGWPMEKSLAGIPQAFMLSLAYGYNVLDRRGPDSPAGRWRVRNLKPWIRSNPPVGALGDKERPATSYVIVATRARDRYFDLDAVRTPHTQPGHMQGYDSREQARAVVGLSSGNGYTGQNAAGAPPRDWWHHVDAVLDACLDDMAGSAGPVSFSMKDRKHTGASNPATGWQADSSDRYEGTRPSARGVHLRRALERAGILSTLEAVDVSPSGYSGAHYAVWPKELVRLLVDEMCPRKVCTTCGEPSRRIVDVEPSPLRPEDRVQRTDGDAGRSSVRPNGKTHMGIGRKATTTGWSDCGHGTWRPGLVLDPFAGSGTTLAVASGMARDATGIDLDSRNADLARDRVGMFLTIDYPVPAEVPA